MQNSVTSLRPFSELPLRGVSPPSIDASSSSIPQTTVPKRLNNLAKATFISQGSQKNEGIQRLNNEFSWQVAKAHALYNTIFQSCIVTEKDYQNIESLKKTVLHLEGELQGRGLSKSQLKAAEKSLKELQKSLFEIQDLAKGLENIYPIQDELDNAHNNLVDRCFSPLYPGESLTGFHDLKDAVGHLVELRQFVDSINENSPTGIRLQNIFKKELDAICFTIREWEEVMTEDMQKEIQWLSKELAAAPKESKPGLLRQLQALKTQQKEILVQLDEFNSQFLGNSSFKTLHDHLSDVSKSISKEHRQVKALGKYYGSAESLTPLVFGNDEWISLVKSRPEYKRNFLEQLTHTLLTPEDWSDTAKAVVFTAFTAMQLSQQTIELSQRLNQVTQLKEQTKLLLQILETELPPEKQKEIEKDSALLATFLSDKYTLALNPLVVKRYSPELRSALEKAALKFGKTPPTRQEISKFQTAFKTHRIIEESAAANLFANLSISDWWSLFTKSEEKAEFSEEKTPPRPSSTHENNAVVLKSLPSRSSSDLKDMTSSAPSLTGWPLTLIKTVGSFIAISFASSHGEFVEQRKSESFNQLSEASQKLVQQEERLKKDEASGVAELRKEIFLLQRELKKTMNSTPNDTCSLLELASWSQAVNDKCYAIQKLEEHIGVLMSNARAALSTNEEELEKFGKKHKHLIEQARLVEGLQLPGIVIPIPHGINSDVVKAFLEKQSPTIFNHWKDLGRMYAEYKGSSPFLEQPESKLLLEKIQQEILHAFEKASQQEDLFNTLVGEEMTSWIEAMDRQQNFLMVRSTGAEDSRLTANAGGNESKNYVNPSRQSICEAAGKVIASYFSFSSLQNRINAKLNPFEDELRLAVDTQELIGEPIGGSLNPKEIPVSLVLFSSEPLYVGGEKFRVMRISATYGHGEAVVEAKGIPTDTALLLISEAHPDRLYVLYDNQAKLDRLAPILTPEGIQLGKIPNPPSLVNRPALNADLLRRLYVWGVVGEKFFGDHPTDMEIVIKGETIYPVQARPINRPDLLPTYLDLKKVDSLPTSPISKKLNGEMLVPGKASVIIAKNANEVLFANTLKKAQDQFLENQHRVVVINQEEPANSHPVVNFSGLGIPCLVIKEEETVIKQLIDETTEQTPLVICVQKGTLNQWDTQTANVEDYTSKGFVIHPARIAVSLPVATPPNVLKKQSEVPQEVLDLILAIKSASTHEIAQSILKDLQQHGWVTALKERKEELAQHLLEHKIIPNEVKTTHTVLQELDHRLELVFNEAQAALSHASSTERLRPLFHLKALEQLLIQKPKSGDSLAQYSVVDVEPLYQQAVLLIDYQKKFSHPCHFADILLKASKVPDQATQQEWQNFLEGLETLVEKGEVSSKEVAQLKSTIGTLEQTGLLSTWFVLFFKIPSPTSQDEEGVDKVSSGLNTITEPVPEKVEQIKSTPIQLTPEQKVLEQLNHILNSLPPQDTVIIKKFLDEYNSIMQFKNQIDRFSNPKSFKEAWDELQQKAQSLSELENLQKDFTNASPVTQTIILKTMEEFVNLYDVAIKTMKASQDWPEKEKLSLFREMLEPYFSIFNSWAYMVNWENILAPEISTNDQMSPETGGRSAKQYLSELKEIMEKLPTDDPSHLLPSEDFSVVTALLSSDTEFNRHHPEHWEDVFTLIHQNLLDIITTLGKEVYDSKVLNDSALPVQLKQYIQDIPELITTYISGSNSLSGGKRSGIVITENEIQVKYNVPLRDHSGQMTLHYDIATGETTIKGYLLGVNEFNRWNTIKVIVDTLNAGGILYSKEKAKFDQNEVSFSWKITSEEELKIACNAFTNLLKISMEPGDLMGKSQDIEGYLDRILTLKIEYDDIQTIPNQIEKWVNQFLMNSDMDYEYSVLVYRALLKIDLANSLIDKFNYERIIQAAANKINDPSPNVRKQSLALFGALVSMEQGYDDAIQFAVKGLSDPDKSVQQSAVGLFGNLFMEKGVRAHYLSGAETTIRIAMEAAEKSFESAIQFAENGIYDRGKAEASLSLYNRLFDNGQGFESAKKIIERGLNDDNPFVKRQAERLLSDFEKKNSVWKRFQQRWIG